MVASYRNNSSFSKGNLLVHRSLESLIKELRCRISLPWDSSSDIFSLCLGVCFVIPVHKITRTDNDWLSFGQEPSMRPISGARLSEKTNPFLKMILKRAGYVNFTLNIYQREMKVYVHTKNCMPMFIVTLSTTVKKWK